jgi:hypothetical protein
MQTQNILDVPGGTQASPFKRPTKLFQDAQTGMLPKVVQPFTPHLPGGRPTTPDNSRNNPPPQAPVMGGKAANSHVENGQFHMRIADRLTSSGGSSFVQKLKTESQGSDKTAVFGAIGRGLSAAGRHLQSAKSTIGKGLKPLKPIVDSKYHNAWSSLAGAGYGYGADVAYEGITGQDSGGVGTMLGLGMGGLSPSFRRLARRAEGVTIKSKLPNVEDTKPFAGSVDFLRRTWRGVPKEEASSPLAYMGLRLGLGGASTAGMIGSIQEQLTPEGFNITRPIQSSRNVLDQQARNLGFADRNEMAYVAQQLKDNPDRRREFMQRIYQRFAG